MYPAVTRDVSRVVKDGAAAADMLKAVRQKAGSLLKEVRVVDYYRGKHIPEGFKGLTISCVYRAENRTLTEEEVSPLHALVLGVLKDDFGAQVR